MKWPEVMSPTFPRVPRAPDIRHHPWPWCISSPSVFLTGRDDSMANKGPTVSVSSRRTEPSGGPGPTWRFGSAEPLCWFPLCWFPLSAHGLATAASACSAREWVQPGWYSVPMIEGLKVWEISKFNGNTVPQSNLLRYLFINSLALFALKLFEESRLG